LVGYGTDIAEEVVPALALDGVGGRLVSEVEGASGAASSLQGFRLSQQLAAEESAGASAPASITSYSTHALNQIAGRDAGIGVSQSALEDAFGNPNTIQYAPSAPIQLKVKDIAV
jgi:uncharacterized protein YfiM (DUF2279 family)